MTATATTVQYTTAVSTINDARYSRYETEHDQIKSELILNPGMKIYKDYSRGYRMILSEDIQQPYITARAIYYWGSKPDSMTSYSLEGKELKIDTIE